MLSFFYSLFHDMQRNVGLYSILLNQTELKNLYKQSYKNFLGNELNE